MLFLIFLLAPLVLANECAYDYKSTKYSRSPLLTIEGLPTNLVYNSNAKTLYFTLIDLETLQDDNVQTKMDQYALNDELIRINNVNGQAAAVHDNMTYIATDKGLYVLNETDKAKFLTLKNEDLVQLFKRETSSDLYAIAYPENKVYRIDLKTNEKFHVKNIDCAFIIAVDSNNNLFYECESKYVKVLLNGYQEPIEYVGLVKNTARALAVDRDDSVILAANDGLYQLRPDNVIPKKVMELDFMPSGIVFYNGNMYIATTGVIYEYTSKNCNYRKETIR